MFAQIRSIIEKVKSFDLIPSSTLANAYWEPLHISHSENTLQSYSSTKPPHSIQAYCQNILQQANIGMEALKYLIPFFLFLDNCWFYFSHWISQVHMDSSCFMLARRFEPFHLHHIHNNKKNHELNKDTIGNQEKHRRKQTWMSKHCFHSRGGAGGSRSMGSHVKGVDDALIGKVLFPAPFM